MLYHILVTRFNVKATVWQQNKNNKPAGDKVWLEKRIPLFLKFCLPSVLQQDCKKFHWLIFFEEGTQNSLNKVFDALKPYSFIIPVFVKGMGEFNESLQLCIKNRMPKEARQIISTRLDNDDAIHKSFIYNLQSACTNEMDRVVLDFPQGLCLNLSPSPRISKYLFPKNQFVSLVETIKQTEKPKLVFSNFHLRLDKDYPIKALSSKGQWLQVVHADNLINTFKGELTFSSVLNGFPNYELSFSKEYNTIVFKKKIKTLFSRLPGYYFIKKIVRKLN